MLQEYKCPCCDTEFELEPPSRSITRLQAKKSPISLAEIGDFYGGVAFCNTPIKIIKAYCRGEASSLNNTLSTTTSNAPKMVATQ